MVLLSLISYPHTQWADPAAKLAAVRHRYPTKPLLVEVSADGSPQAKAQWLIQVGRAVRQTKGVYALIYHEGTPDIKETAAADHAWSLASDPRSLAAMFSIVHQLDAPPAQRVSEPGKLANEAVLRFTANTAWRAWLSGPGWACSNAPCPSHWAAPHKTTSLNCTTKLSQTSSTFYPHDRIRPDLSLFVCMVLSMFEKDRMS